MLIAQKSGKGDALRKEKALLRPFVAGQKYGVGRDDPLVLFAEKEQVQQIKHLLHLLFTAKN
ncbi:MAG: hypothetical protein JRE01_07405 [Deltaproteobacteria bacterium]|nr:hypothetical protein [Deltaproteobacteria bacterium]